MKRFAILAVLAILPGCGGPEYPPPAADRAQLVVKLVAKANPAVPAKRGESGDPYSTAGRDPERGRRYARVDYDDLEDIAVWLKGPGLGEGGPVPKAARLAVGPDGADHRLVLLGPKKTTQLTIANGTERPMTFGCLGRTDDGFVATVASHGTAAVTLSDPGVYELTADEDESLHVTVVVAPTTWAALGRSGEEVFFDGLPPGEFDVVVQAPRLPEVVRRVAAKAGARATVDAEVSVTCLECVK